MRQQLFVTDFDGTLLNDDKTVSQKDIDTLQALKSKNVIVAVATGRSDYLFQNALSAMEAGVDSQDFPIDYMVHKAIPDTYCFVYKCFGDHNPDFHARLALYKKFIVYHQIIIRV